MDQLRWPDRLMQQGPPDSARHRGLARDRVRRRGPFPLGGGSRIRTWVDIQRQIYCPLLIRVATNPAQLSGKVDSGGRPRAVGRRDGWETV